MAKKSTKIKNKLDKDGFIFPLAVGALALIFFSWYFLTMNNKKDVVVENPIQSIEDLNAASKDLDSENPDAFNADLKTNSTDASGL